MKKEPKNFNDLMNIFSHAFGEIGSSFDLILKTPVNTDGNISMLGRNIYLIDIDVPENKQLHKMGYGNLYKIDEQSGTPYIFNNTVIMLKKISNNIFRVGGMSNGFGKNVYCSLIYYEHVSNKKHSCLGNHCIIDTEGKIIFEADSPVKYPYYQKGCIVKYENYYINLKTGKPIVSGYNSISSENYLFVVCSSFKDEFPKGVYKIEYSTGNFEIIN